jgi:hypothetical protein
VARLARFLIAGWWGSLTTIGFVVVPLLFVHLETPAMAGQMAAKLFEVQTWITLFCGLMYLLAQRRMHGGAPVSPSMAVLAALLSSLLLELAVKPHIVARDNLMLWHNLGSALYVLQWLCVSSLLWQTSKEKATDAVADSEA